MDVDPEAWCQVSSEFESKGFPSRLDYVGLCILPCFFGEAKRLILRMPEEASLEAQKVRVSLRFGMIRQCHAALGWHAAVARYGLAKPALRCLDS